MKRVVVALVLSLTMAGCLGGSEVTSDGQIRFYHDDAHGVGCWTTYDKSISCLPDKDYGR